MPVSLFQPLMNCKLIRCSKDIHLFLENPPQDQSDRWSGRPFRSLSVVIPPAPINLDPTQTESDKQRFLENLWKAQATYRARAGQSVVLCSDEQEVECRSGRTTLARTYYNVYQRTAFLQEPKKVGQTRNLILRYSNEGSRAKSLYTSTATGMHPQIQYLSE